MVIMHSECGVCVHVVAEVVEVEVVASSPQRGRARAPENTFTTSLDSEINQITNL